MQRILVSHVSRFSCSKVNLTSRIHQSPSLGLIHRSGKAAFDVKPPTTLLIQRNYRGEATESPPASLSDHEQSLLAKAQPKAKEIMEKHLAMPNLDEIPAHSMSDVSSELDIRRKRLVYRSKQRGWLEVDLLLGTWASEHVSTLNAAQLDDYEAFVNQETIDIYNIITLRVGPEDMPDTLRDNAIVHEIQTWAKSSPLGKADPEAYKQMKEKAQLI